jgi:protein Mpv17
VVVGTTLKQTVAKMALDQLVFSPPFLAGVFTFLGALEGKSLDEIKGQLGKVWAPTLVRNWIVWVPIQMLNFGVIPARYQVMVSNLAGVAWNGYLSWVSQQEKMVNAAASEK